MVSALEINSNGGLKQEHGESCRSTVAASYLHYYNAFFFGTESTSWSKIKFERFMINNYIIMLSLKIQIKLFKTFH